MLVAKAWIGRIERKGKGCADVGLQAIAQADKLLAREVVGIDVGGIVSRNAFVVLRDLAVVDLHTVQLVL